MNEAQADVPGLAPEQREYLRELARAVITAAVTGRQPPSARKLAAARGLELGPALLDERGAFVTLHRTGRLRGCIGYIEGVKPVVEAVADNARGAALYDPRFPAVQEAELSDLQIEISVLSPLRPVAGPQDIVLGEHGIMLSKGSARAVFLPQVAVEQGWDLHTTLGHLALKAGLGPAGWQDGTRFSVFTADIF